MSFQSTLPVWGATSTSAKRPPSCKFQSTLPVWGATRWSSAPRRRRDFNPRSPCGERRRQRRVPRVRRADFNPRSPCGERPRLHAEVAEFEAISIHAPRVGSDVALYALLEVFVISIHAPRVGSDRTLNTLHVMLAQFQSTLPVWGATERLGLVGLRVRISIHAPRVGSDRGPGAARCTTTHFNPRSPCGERP